MSVLMMHINDPVPDLKQLNKDIPDVMVGIVQKALAKDRNNRYQSAAEFAQALRNMDAAISTPAPAGKTTIEPIPAGADATMVEEQPVTSTPLGTLVEGQAPLSKEKATIVKDTPAVKAQDRGPSRSATASPKPSSPGGMRIGNIPLPLMIGGGIVGILILVGVIILGSRAFGVSSQEATETMTATITVPPEPSIEVPTNTPEPTATPEPTFTPTATAVPEPFVRINSIQIENGTYLVEYETFGFTEILPGVHIHFFFNNIAPEQAGAGGSGPWYLWGGPRPFDGYRVGDRPADATQMCALQANANHTINLGTGNCMDLPSE